MREASVYVTPTAHNEQFQLEYKTKISPKAKLSESKLRKNLRFEMGNYAPTLKINWKESVPHYQYNPDNNTITVEQGTPFLLKFEISAWPIPTHVDLYKDGNKVQISRTNGTIFVGLDRVGIPSVDRQSYAGNYTISTTNSQGEGHIAFRLIVKATHAYTQLEEETDDNDPSRWC